MVTKDTNGRKVFNNHRRMSSTKRLRVISPLPQIYIKLHFSFLCFSHVCVLSVFGDRLYVIITLRSMRLDFIDAISNMRFALSYLPALEFLLNRKHIFNQLLTKKIAVKNVTDDFPAHMIEKDNTQKCIHFWHAIRVHRAIIISTVGINE